MIKDVLPNWYAMLLWRQDSQERVQDRTGGADVWPMRDQSACLLQPWKVCLKYKLLCRA